MREINVIIDIFTRDKEIIQNEYFIHKAELIIKNLNTAILKIEEMKEENEIKETRYKNQIQKLLLDNDKLELICYIFGISDLNYWLILNTYEDLKHKLYKLNMFRRKCLTPIDIRNRNALKLTSKKLTDQIFKQYKEGKTKKLN